MTEQAILRLNSDWGARDDAADVYLCEVGGGRLVYEGSRGRLEIDHDSHEALDGDVILAVPGRGTAHRLIRATSLHNTLLVTERCDQLCVMCSQPPKNYELDLFDQYAQACCLAPRGAIIGVSGGEPTLYKARLFDLFSTVLAQRPDLSFHVLSNGQHFVDDDVTVLQRLPRGKVNWGIPVYAAEADVHDRIVGKAGAFSALDQGLAILGQAGVGIELRTVLMASNAGLLPALAQFLSTNVPFAYRWAIMQMEYFGFARKVWKTEFFDSSVKFESVGAALDIARGRGLNAVLYNFPRCTVPLPYRTLATPAISDWKQKFADECASCSERSDCGGFFAWHPTADSFRNVRAL